MVGGFLLLFTFFNVIVEKKDYSVENASVMIGIIYAICTMAIGNATGSSLNPARNTGPVIITNQHKYFGELWIYWLGPILGGLIGSFTYILVCMDTTPNEALKGVDYEDQVFDALKEERYTEQNHGKPQ